MQAPIQQKPSLQKVSQGLVSLNDSKNTTQEKKSTESLRQLEAKASRSAPVQALAILQRKAEGRIMQLGGGNRGRKKKAAPPSQEQKNKVPQGQKQAGSKKAPKKKTDGGRKGGIFIGDEAQCHLHLNIGNPHFKVGKDKGSRKDFNQNEDLGRKQEALDIIRAKYSNLKGAEDCIKWLQAEGCQ